MNYRLYIFLLVIICSSCASTKQNKWLEEHKSSLSSQNLADLNTDEKVDVLMESYVLMMHQSLDFLNPKKGFAFAEDYNEANKDVIIAILNETNESYGSLSKAQKIGKGIALMGKPYSADFVELFPRFRKKYKLLNKVTDVNERIKEAILERLGL